MKNLKLKPFLIIFFILMVIQFLTVLADVQLTKSESSLVSVTNPLIDVFSLPISTINGNLPFYVREGIPVKALYWIMNLLIQAGILYLGILFFRKLRKKLK